MIWDARHYKQLSCREKKMNLVYSIMKLDFDAKKNNIGSKILIPLL